MDKGTHLKAWVAAQVKSQLELSVASTLRRKGYETFVPTCVRTRQWSDRKKVWHAPLISGYVFVREPEQMTQALIISTPGVLGLVRCGGQMARIGDDEIERLKIVVNSSCKTEPWSYLKQGSRVRIVRGALSGISGTLLRVGESNIFIVSVHILQRSVAVHIDRSWVEAA